MLTRVMRPTAWSWYHRFPAPLTRRLLVQVLCRTLATRGSGRWPPPFACLEVSLAVDPHDDWLEEGGVLGRYGGGCGGGSARKHLMGPCPGKSNILVSLSLCNLVVVIMYHGLFADCDKLLENREI
jgi:hypothetical protein